PAAVAGRIYRELNSRFGTPVNLQLATAPGADDPKAAELNEEEKDAAEADAAEAAAELAAQESMAADAKKSAVPADAPVRPPLETEMTAPRSTVKPVLMQIPRRPADAPKNTTSQPNGPAKTTLQPAKNVSSGGERPRRTQPN
nr:hypothetical protein [Pyrinomonadaceae bacterium]